MLRNQKLNLRNMELQIGQTLTKKRQIGIKCKEIKEPFCQFKKLSASNSQKIKKLSPSTFFQKFLIKKTCLIG